MSTQSVRPPAVAGSFYPGGSDVLTDRVDGLLAAARKIIAPPKALVLPHAGYDYSGGVAAAGFAQLTPVCDSIKRVVLLGPNHTMPLRGIAMPAGDAFRTPLGEIPLDRKALAALEDLPFCTVDDAPHAKEHSLEVMLPFLQRLLGGFSLVPLVVGQTMPEEVCKVLARLWGGPETLIIVSTDLSHFLTDGEARKTDMKTARAVETMKFSEIGREDACGRYPLAGLLAFANARNMRITRLGLLNSGQTSGRADRVVGYGAWGLEYAASARMSDANREILKGIASAAIVEGAKTGTAPEIDMNTLPVDLRTIRACFTTLTVDGRFRGCRGTVRAAEPIAVDAAQNAFLSAFEDPRVPPLSQSEAERAEIGISILSNPGQMKISSEVDLLEQLSPDEDGLILEEGKRRALFLPKVWDDLPDARDFLTQLKRKGGWPAEYWSEDMRAYRFSAEYF